MNKCITCKLLKDNNEFNKNRRMFNGLSSNCRLCTKAYVASRERNPYTKYKQVQRGKLADYCNQIKVKYGCQLCPENSFETLDFHHVDPTQKESTIARLVGKGKSIKKLIEEVNKCVVLCANCHRKIHAGTKTLEQAICCHEIIPARS